jgi:hypothetical protein
MAIIEYVVLGAASIGSLALIVLFGLVALVWGDEVTK